MNSKGHRDAMLDPSVNLLGISQLGAYATLNLRSGNPVDQSLFSQTSPQEITSPSTQPSQTIAHSLNQTVPDQSKIADQVKPVENPIRITESGRRNYDDLIEINPYAPPRIGFKEEVEDTLNKLNLSESLLSTMRAQGAKFVLTRDIPSTGIYNDPARDGCRYGNRIYLASEKSQAIYNAQGQQWNEQRQTPDSRIRGLIGHELGHLLMNSADEVAADLFGAILTGEGAEASPTSVYDPRPAITVTEYRARYGDAYIEQFRQNHLAPYGYASFPATTTSSVVQTDPLRVARNE